MSRYKNISVVFTLLVAAAGCDQARPGSRTHRAVVADLDVVAKALGRDLGIQQQVEVATRNLNAQLVQAAQAMQDELNVARATFGEQPTEPQQKRIEQLAAVANQNVRTNKLIARTRQQEIRNELVGQFRDEVRPIAERIARERGASVVLLSPNDLLWFDPKADITDELIAELRASAVSSRSVQPSARMTRPASSGPSPATSRPPQTSRATSARESATEGATPTGDEAPTTSTTSPPSDRPESPGPQPPDTKRP